MTRPDDGGPLRADRTGFEFTGDKPIPGTKLTGSKLLDPNLPTEEWITEKYIDPLLQKQGIKPWRAHKPEESFFLWKWGTTLLPSKTEGNKMVRNFPFRGLGIAAAPARPGS